MKLIIAGSRNGVPNDKLIYAYLWFVEKHGKPEEIVSGAAKGVDSQGEEIARMAGIKIKRFHAKWFYEGAMAGPNRNARMAKYATHLLAFPDPSRPSPGTKNMILLAHWHGLAVEVIG